MKVLLSAYACEPNRGSEPGVGWHWALEVEKLGHQVWVLTRKNNNDTINDYWSKNNKPDNLNFIYYDVPKWLSWWKKGGRGVRIYYFLWQIGAFFVARSAHKSASFDQVQHITFVSVRQPSFMGFLGIPFLFGPVGGGESTPIYLRKHFSIKGKFKDYLRDVANFLVKIDPFMHLTFLKAGKIYVTSEQSKFVIPKIYHRKVLISLAIGSDSRKNKAASSNVKSHHDKFKVLYVGRFEYWKGMGIGLHAFSALQKKNSNATLTMVGSGPDKKNWKKQAYQLGIHNIEWIEWLPQEQLSILYKKHDIFLFPSLHDSGGMVVLEAMAEGLPVVCLDLGGPGVMVDDSCGIKIDVDGLDEKEVIDKLCEAILDFSSNSEKRVKLIEGALNKAKGMSWKSTVEQVYSGNVQKSNSFDER